MSEDLSGYTAVVTGASSGIGFGVASALAEEGANVALWSRSMDRLRAAVEGLPEECAARTLCHEVDVRSGAQVEAAAEEAFQRLGAVDLLVNAAGTAGPAGLDWEVDPEAWWECVETSVRGSFLCTRSVLPGMLREEGGRIVDLVSVTGTGTFPLIGATSVAKTALIRHVENLAAATEGTGVFAFALHPGTVRTKLLQSYRSDPRMAAFLDGLPAEAFTEPRAVGRVVRRIARGELDDLSGRFIDATSDLDGAISALAAGPADALTLRLRSPRSSTSEA